MIIPIKQILLENGILNKPLVIIFGENHFVNSEVESIRQKIIKLKPNVILHELLYDDNNYEYNYFKKVLPDTKLLDLEAGISKNNSNPLWKKSLKEQFKTREEAMIKNIEDALRKYKKIVIVVGDTHLRTIDTPELGSKSKLNKYATELNRSKFSEIR